MQVPTGSRPLRGSMLGKLFLFCQVGTTALKYMHLHATWRCRFLNYNGDFKVSFL